jgi:mannitol/fructose-specific phosphotransferase system IIA component
VKHEARYERRKASRPIVGVSESSDENVDNILDINDNISLDKIVEKLNKNSE